MVRGELIIERGLFGRASIWQEKHELRTNICKLTELREIKLMLKIGKVMWR
jgi:hypothetical protein